MAGKGKLSTIYLTPLTRDKLSETDIGAFVIGLLNFSEIVLEKWEEGEGGGGGSAYVRRWCKKW